MGGGVGRSVPSAAGQACARTTPPPNPLPQGEGEESFAAPMSATTVAPSRFARLRGDQRLAIAIPVGVLLVLLMLPPMWMLVQDSLTTTDAIGNVTGWTFGHFTKL